MPSRNLEKDYAEDTYYHVYNRGVEERVIFPEKADYVVFLSLLKRYLGKEISQDIAGRQHPNYSGEISLLAFCLMPNHFHLLVYQSKKNSMTRLLRGVCTAYAMYFNKKYKRVGHLFQNRFKAAMITKDSYLLHISRYIHLNPDKYLTWEFSSLPYYLSNKKASWVDPLPILELFNQGEYEEFLEDYLDYRQSLIEIKHNLADS
ncbi:hypothetical protein A3B63_03310 [Candidatus Saccharibacteria bacterium RIFCSPLOWO2_01_FULL_49_22]|nr:MAG: hypothetical protein A3B63_03310 [Candidatus Saccharibacteria bacterium RIFCSPLOWO2_01_FULL_49_22]